MKARERHTVNDGNYGILYGTNKRNFFVAFQCGSTSWYTDSK